MFIYSVKANTLKLACCVMAAIAIMVSLIVFVPEDEAYTVLADGSKVVYTDVTDNEARINFLKQFGWQVEAEPISEEKVTVPKNFDSVFAGYNDLQKLQGLDLARYKRRELTRYTYVVTNYEEYDGKVLANILVYRGRVVGGDICTESSDGFIHGFEKSTHL